MRDKSEFTLYKPSHGQEDEHHGGTTFPEKPPPTARVPVLAQPLPRNPTLFPMLTQEISHQFGSIRLVWSARPPKVAAVCHNLIPVAPHQQETSDAGSESMPYHKDGSRPGQREPVLHFLSHYQLF
jgi:hypothetical protein